MVEHHPVHNSEVYLLGLAPRPSVPPPSPPSPLSPTAAGSSTPIEQLCLDSTDIEDSESVQDAASVAARRIAGAIHVLNTEATALRCLTQLYKTDATVSEGFNAAVDAIVRQSSERGKLVIIGVGKSGHIGKKLVATFNSLGVHATFLHPTEALHGDLGKISKHDVVLFITFSGKTPELLALLPHVEPTLPVIVLTSHSQPTGCELIRQRPGAVLLPAPIHEPETVSFGVSAPTTSTTVALALGDALAVVASQELHGCVSSVFARNHPGGAIGAAFAKSDSRTIRDVAVPLCDIPSIAETTPRFSGVDVLRAGYHSDSGWVQMGDSVASPTRIRRLDTLTLSRLLNDIPDLLVNRSEWLGIDASTPIAYATRWIRDLIASPNDGEMTYSEDHIISITDAGEVIGVLEAGDLLKACE
ncbi:SIS domain-containing protein [Xylariaceae sp. FL1019]|nr:SIS domain-containing protein [Xylariaceae sp. FL1019]